MKTIVQYDQFTYEEKHMTTEENDYILYLHKNLRLLRKINDMTQREVAEQVYIDRSSYSY